MNILITGGTGFLGSHLAEKLIKDGHEVTTFDNQFTGNNVIPGASMIKGDIVDRLPIQTVVSNSDLVLHLAGVLGTSEMLNMIQRANIVNINGTVNVLQACMEYDVPLVFSSKPNPPGFLNPYTITKIAAESYCLMYHQMYGVEVSIPRLMYLYGPRQRVYPEVNYRKYIPAFVTKALRNEPIKVYGDGLQMIDPLYIEDAVSIMVRIIEDMTSSQKLDGKVYDVGTGVGYTVNDIVHKIIELTSSKSSVRYVAMRKGEPEHSTVIANLHESVALDAFSQVQLTCLEDGLVKTIPYYEEWLKQCHKI